VADEFLRDDIAQCVDGNPGRRFGSATELAKRLRALRERAMQRDQDRRAAGAAARRKHLLRAASVFAAACLLIAIISAAGYLRERTLRSALSESEANARKSE